MQNRMSWARRAFGLAAVLGFGLVSGSAWALTQVSSFGSNPGNLQMFKHVPSGLPSGAPLVVALHGCTQTAAAYEASGWSALANQYKFAVVYPQQQSGNNQNKCFNWFESGDITRGQGEALSIKQMVDKMKADHGVDASRVYVTGLSAGGFMTDVMLATYPDVFAGGAPVAGGPYKCATSMTAAFSCMSPGVDKTAKAWGDLARGGYSSWSGRRPLVSIWHGDADYTVKQMNQTEQMEQWTNVHGADQTADVSNTVKGYPHKVYRNGSGTAVVETYTISGMGHGTPVDPGSNADQCGSAGSYILDVNICSSYYIAQFWGLLGGSTGGGGGGSTGDTTAPSVNVTAPSNGATVTGTVTLSASASDNVGVTKVEFYVGSTLVGTDTSSPYSLSWNSGSVANGTYTVKAKAFDAAGNTALDQDTTVTVSNSGGTGGWVCKEYYSSNYNHVSAGRAYNSYGYAKAKGSNQNMGLNNTYYYTRLAETSSGYYVIGNCP